jgi:RNA polymerase sigma-70 factor (ECF subfamily)
MLAAALMDRIRPADADAFMDALDHVLPDAYRLAFAMVRNPDEAGDIVQESALKAWRHRRSFREGAPIRPWFLAIVANQCRRIVTSRWWSVLKRADVMVATQSSGTTDVEEAESLRYALMQLTERDRLVVVLRYYLDLPFDEVAVTLGISPGAARVRAHRALARLRPIVDVGPELTNG